MHTNRLVDEKSPYLLQHAHNPVDWYPWGEEAFAKARAEDKPIFLSIGYSTCHWCHVMERESFENEGVAEVLNRFFVPIKVDREERPDVDRIYMMFVQATTGGGGWPMSVWLTPDLKPFFGGTYFPPDNRYGRPGFKHILEQLANAWLSDRAKIQQSSVDVLEELKKHAEVRGGTGIEAASFDHCFYGFRRMFDARLGGFGNAPKFPRPSVHNFLVRHYKRKQNQEALDMVLKTLDEMAKGGMNDQLGGGFHRYSVDERWFVPHFEKMLYDQAQLAWSYLEALQITGRHEYEVVARRIFDYVLRDMRHPQGGFYSAEDADSPLPENPHEKGEGAFFIWKQSEIEEALGQPAAEWFCYRYGVEEDGNVRQDPHGEFTGKNILYEARSIEDVARRFDVGAAQVEASLTESAAKLLAIRERRPRPHLDDKVLTAWNGLMVSAFAKGAQVLSDNRYEEAAVRAADFVLSTMYRDGVLLRRFRDGDAAIPGFLDDYAFFGLALVDLYETTFELRYLETAVELARSMRLLFEDQEHGGFYSTAPEEGNLVLRLKDDYDGAEPSGNSAAAMLLLRLAQFTNDGEFQNAANRTLEAFASRLNSAPIAVPQMMVALDFATSKPKQVILVGERGSEGIGAMLRALRSRFVPNSITVVADGPEAQRKLAEWNAPVAQMTAVEGKATAYVCENYACQLPVNDVEKFVELLQ
ncbi:MAG: thioredoxin domain-containing protein [Bryobacteraceae bacterium]|nr:thioredoxin domain-containing protein [Bryobacteraceae bacterium]